MDAVTQTKELFLPLAVNVLALLAFGAGAAIYVDRKVSELRKELAAFKDWLLGVDDGAETPFRTAHECERIHEQLKEQVSRLEKVAAG